MWQLFPLQDLVLGSGDQSLEGETKKNDRLVLAVRLEMVMEKEDEILPFALFFHFTLNGRELCSQKDNKLHSTLFVNFY